MSGNAVSWMVQFEWLIFEVALLAFLGWELYSVRRSMRKDREAAAKAKAESEASDGTAGTETQ
jgi:hypothetical protein